jgi:alkylation response protein AidB-like acyl-CoA dehydrogenase
VIGDLELELFQRGVRDAVGTSTGPALDAALAALGWEDAFHTDTRAAVATLFECLGSADARSSSLDHLLCAALGSPATAATAVVLPPLEETRPPGRAAGDGWSVRGLLMTAAVGDGPVVVVASRADGSPAALTAARASLVTRQVAGLDPRSGLVEVMAGVVDGDPLTVGADWESAVALAQRALGHELVGAARAMLALGRGHALERVQFGRPIASFQAVRHRLAESLVAVEAADALLAASWDDPTPINAAMAKAFAGRAARTVARHCQQVLAGIGFTTEHPFHRYLRRTILLDQLLGGRSLTRRLGTSVLASGQLPPVLPL